MELLIPLYLDMAGTLFQLLAYVLGALVCTAIFALLRHRFRQRGLHKIPGPPNVSHLYGKIHG